MQSDEVICLLAGSSFDSLCPSQAPRCQSHPWVVLCKARAPMLVSAVGGSSGSGCQCWLGVWAAPPGSAVNASVTALSPSPPCVRNPCLSLHTQASTRFPYCQILCSSESKFLHHSLDILLVWFHHIIPWRFFFFFEVSQFVVHGESRVANHRKKASFPHTSPSPANASAPCDFCLIVLPSVPYNICH